MNLLKLIFRCHSGQEGNLGSSAGLLGQALIPETVCQLKLQWAKRFIDEIPNNIKLLQVITALIARHTRFMKSTVHNI